MTLTLDLVRHGHVTLQMTYLISGFIHARDMIFFVSMVSWVEEMSMAYRPNT